MDFSFPSPTAFYLGSYPVRWYGLSYAAGLFLALAWNRYLCKTRFKLFDRQDFSNFLTYAMIGIILGGRLGEVLLFQPHYYFSHPAEILKTWKGGMSFHGGCLGLVLSALWYCRIHRLPFLSFMDCIACCAPLGLLCGRIANFINQELYGIPAPSDFPLAIIFPSVDHTLRHPSQLYEAFWEGIGLFILLNGIAFFTPWIRYKGRLCGLFLLGYGLARWGCEYFRDPGQDVLFLFNHVFSKGQIYCIPFFLGGIFLIWASAKIFQNSFQIKGAESENPSSKK